MGPYERQAFLINDRCAARSDRKGEWDDARHAQHLQRRQSRRPRSRPFRTADLVPELLRPSDEARSMA